MEKPMKVMLAEEGSEYGQTCANVLRSYGYEVTLVPKDGSEVISRLPIHTPDVLLMDEPTTHLDLLSVEALVQALKHYEGTLVFISHDVHFIRSLAQKTLHVNRGTITAYAGGYDYYLEKSGILDDEKGGITAE